jgi:hypothetical protein
MDKMRPLLGASVRSVRGRKRSWPCIMGRTPMDADHEYEDSNKLEKALDVLEERMRCVSARRTELTRQSQLIAKEMNALYNDYCTLNQSVIGMRSLLKR